MNEITFEDLARMVVRLANIIIDISSQERVYENQLSEAQDCLDIAYPLQELIDGTN